jgi:hypothetical protein
MSLKGGLKRAGLAAVGGARAKALQSSYALSAPSAIDEVDRANARSMFLWLRARFGSAGRGPRQHSYGAWRPEYAWGIVSAAMVAAALGRESISVIEFGVAGGNGLLAMEAASREVEQLLGVSIAVFGFDTGRGMPAPVDHRDAPFAVRPGQFDMDEEALRARLQRAELKLGQIEDTASEFLREQRPPVGFVGFDVDYYSSTTAALGIFEGESDRLLPHVFCYFQGLMWHPWTEFNGARAAINDFNGAHERRKLSPLYGLKYSLPRSEYAKPWPEMMYVAELFDHTLHATDRHIEAFDTRLAEE